jgi:hypothetical protein
VNVGKNTRGIKEFTREQRLIKENRQLKKELGHLRKQISRLDLEGIETAKQMIYDQEEKDRLNESLNDSSSSLEALKKEWACKKCSTGWLEITLYSKLSQTHYYRKCNNCDNRTKGQRYDPSTVRGIIFNNQKKLK